MRLTLFHDWIRRIYATQDEELDCDQVFKVIARYVDVEAEGGQARACFPGVAHHLLQCTHCYDLYLGLRDAVALENQEASAEEVLIENC